MFKMAKYTYVILGQFSTETKAKKHVRELKTLKKFKRAKLVIRKEVAPKWYRKKYKYPYHVYVKTTKPSIYYV